MWDHSVHTTQSPGPARELRAATLPPVPPNTKKLFVPRTEEPLELGVNLERNVVVAVGAGMADVRGSESLDDRWMRAGKVVAGEGSKRAHRSILTSTSVIDA